MSERETRKLWGTTHCPGARVRIYECPDIDDEQPRRNAGAWTWALTQWKHGVCGIYLGPKLLAQPQCIGQVLLHEFVHVVEYLNDPHYLSATPVDDCTRLAQTMEKQLYPLMANLRLEAHDAKLNPFRSLRRR